MKHTLLVDGGWILKVEEEVEVVAGADFPVDFLGRVLFNLSLLELFDKLFALLQ